MNVIKHATAHDNDERKNEPRIDFQIHTQSSAQPNNIACFNFVGIKIEFQLNCRCCWIYWYCAVRWQLFNDNRINKTILIFGLKMALRPSILPYWQSQLYFQLVRCAVFSIVPNVLSTVWINWKQKRSSTK